MSTNNPMSTFSPLQTAYNVFYNFLHICSAHSRAEIQFKVVLRIYKKDNGGFNESENVNVFCTLSTNTTWLICCIETNKVGNWRWG